MRKQCFDPLSDLLQLLFSISYILIIIIDWDSLLILIDIIFKLPSDLTVNHPRHTLATQRTRQFCTAFPYKNNKKEKNQEGSYFSLFKKPPKPFLALAPLSFYPFFKSSADSTMGVSFLQVQEAKSDDQMAGSRSCHPIVVTTRFKKLPPGPLASLYKTEPNRHVTLLSYV